MEIVKSNYYLFWISIYHICKLSTFSKFNIKTIEDFYKEKFNFDIFDGVPEDKKKQFILENLPKELINDDFYYLVPDTVYSFCYKLEISLKSSVYENKYIKLIPTNSKIISNQSGVFVFHRNGSIFRVFSPSDFNQEALKALKEQQILNSPIIIETTKEESAKVDQCIVAFKNDSVNNFNAHKKEKFGVEDDDNNIKYILSNFYPILKSEFIANLRIKIIENWMKNINMDDFLNILGRNK